MHTSDTTTRQRYRRHLWQVGGSAGGMRQRASGTRRRYHGTDYRVAVLVLSGPRGPRQSSTESMMSVPRLLRR
ncbi:hypothetical protein E2C01_042168 [Portunus trituberculatus]|uniref:Uncharacterized protein n=1 Tax=Portunus trituberculatus TaxID=210409 RepID=A0A5B7FSB6_PORTR|nr:hypothetical protein [Portunus trituberculatus]